MSEPYDDERPPVEGVRILGAEEARASLGERRTHDDDLVDLEAADPQLDLRQPVPTVGSDPSTAASRTDRDATNAEVGRTETTRTANPDDILPGREPARERPIVSPTVPADTHTAAVRSGDAAADESGEVLEARLDEAPTGEVPPLPHWTEPPTGAVPAIFSDDGSASDELDTWATVTGAQPRFRAGSDWDESDFAEDLSGEEAKLGALSNEGPVDEDAAFERDLAARRRRPGGGTRTATPRRVPRARAGTPNRVEVDRPNREVAPARDLPTAIMTGLAVAVVAVVSFTHNATTVALACVVVGVATLELAGSLHKRGLRPATLVALVASTLMPVAARHYGPSAYPVFFAMVVIVSLLWFLWEITPGRPLPGVASTVLVFAYVGGLGGFAGLILASPQGHGVRLLLGVALCVIAYDVVGFFVGSQFGHTPVAPKISPNKTVEGSVAGMIAAVVVGAAIVGQFHPWTPGKGVALGVLVAAGAFMGDLCESMLKRDLDLKDFGSLLPGHGGVLDRFDSLLFCLPIGYYLALQFKIF
ncbi:MAG TPA: phosphatidate cytidylyltransferase [Acidimicrobiia bacterium]|nr:phosphatidate cytidylyltransferase [Acidimicrobiia bacterium]